MSSSTRREYFSLSIRLRPEDGLIPVARLIAGLRDLPLADVMTTLKHGAFNLELTNRDEALAFFNQTRHLDHFSGYNVEERDEQGRPTDGCSWRNLYSYFAS